MKLKIVIDMGNAAFSDAPEWEVARILRDYADRIEGGRDMNAFMMDVNGNRVGEAKVTR